MPVSSAGSIMYCRCGHKSVVLLPLPHREGWGGSSHATCRAKRGGNGREDGDYDVEDFSPGCVVVECSHSVLCFDYSLQI